MLGWTGDHRRGDRQRCSRWIPAPSRGRAGAAFDRDGYYDHPDDPWRFAVLCRAALAALRRDGTPLDVLHVHDWHTGPALLERARGDAARDPFFAEMAVVLTLHNLAYHGWVPRDDLGLLGLAPGDPLAGPNADGLDLLLTAIEGSDLANTVSPGFAREALTPAFGMGLDGALLAMGDRFGGILNGIDPDTWNPATDLALAAPSTHGTRPVRRPAARTCSPASGSTRPTRASCWA